MLLWLVSLTELIFLLCWHLAWHCLVIITGGLYFNKAKIWDIEYKICIFWISQWVILLPYELCNRPHSVESLWLVECRIWRSEVQFLMGIWNFFSLSHACDKDEKKILLFFFTKLKAYHLSFLSKNITLLTLLILAVCRRCVIWSIRARNLKVWGLIPHGDSDLFFFVPLLWQDGKKNIFL